MDNGDSVYHNMSVLAEVSELVVVEGVKVGLDAIKVKKWRDMNAAERREYSASNPKPAVITIDLSPERRALYKSAAGGLSLRAWIISQCDKALEQPAATPIPNHAPTSVEPAQQEDPLADWKRLVGLPVK